MGLLRWAKNDEKSMVVGITQDSEIMGMRNKSCVTQMNHATEEEKEMSMRGKMQ